MGVKPLSHLNGSIFIMQKLRSNIRCLIEKNFFHFYFLYHFFKFLKLKNRICRYIRKNKLKHFSTLQISDYKNNDSLFILGSGASINEYTEKEWEIIRHKNSIGFNFWLIHDFIPTFYMFEPTRYEENNEIYFEIFSHRAELYKDVPIIGKDLETGYFDVNAIPKNLRKNIFIPYRAPIPGSNETYMAKALQLIVNYKLFSNCNTMLFRRASLSYLISFGVLAGYKNIILCGVDLNNARYFYEDKSYSNKGFRIPETRPYTHMHSTVDKAFTGETIDMVVLTLYDFLLKPQGIRLYIGSKKSLLYPDLPFYPDFED